MIRSADEPIVITGRGVVSCFGCDVESLFAALLRGVSGARPVAAFAHLGLRRTEAATVDRPEVWRRAALSEGEVTFAAALGIVAARNALADARLEAEVGDAGLFFGNSLGAPGYCERQGKPWTEIDLADPTTLFRTPLGSIGAELACHLGVHGEVRVLGSTCAAGNYALGMALDALSLGRAPFALAGGSEELSATPYLGFHQIRALAEVCRPFDAQRRGTLFGEGAAFLVLEPLTRARARGATVYGQLLAVGYSNDAHHMMAPHPEGKGAALAIRRALDAAGVQPQAIAYVNAHGTGTESNDVVESQAIAAALGEAARDVVVSSTKGATGHLMGAASALEAVITLEALRQRVATPTVGLQTLDPSVATPNILATAQPLRGEVALSSGFGFGGNNAVAALCRTPRAVPHGELRSVYVHRSTALVGALSGSERVRAHIVSSADCPKPSQSTLDVVAVLGKKGLRHVERGTLLLAALVERDLRTFGAGAAPERCGVVIGGAFLSLGGWREFVRELQRFGPTQVNPMHVPYCAANSAASWLLLRRGLSGFSGTISTAECSGLDAVRAAAEQIARGRVDEMLAAAVEPEIDVLTEAARRAGQAALPASDVIAVLELSARAHGAWARLVGSAAAFAGDDPTTAAAQACLAASAAASRKPDLWVVAGGVAPVDGPAWRVIDAALGNTRGAGGLLGIVAAEAALAASGCRAGILSMSPLGYASALILERL